MAPKQDAEMIIHPEYSKMDIELEVIRKNIKRLKKENKRISQQRIKSSCPRKYKVLLCESHENIKLLIDYRERREVLRVRKAELMEQINLRLSNYTEESVSFKDAEVSHITRITGLNTRTRFWKIDMHTDVKPCANFKKAFKTKLQVWSFSSTASLRTILDIFFQDVVARPEFGFQLTIFCEVKTEVSVIEGGNNRLKLGGFHDYIFGHSQPVNVTGAKVLDESRIIAVAANEIWESNLDVWRCVAEAAALHKARKDAHKHNCSVWGIVSDAFRWNFIKIDHEGKLWRSSDYLLGHEVYNKEQV